MAVLSQMIVVLFPPKLRQLLSDWPELPKKFGQMLRELPRKFGQMLRQLLEALGLKHKRDDKTPEKKANEVLNHMAATYSNLRYGLAIISAVFPLWLKYIGEWWYGISSQGSMSAYYWAESTGDGPGRRALRSLNLVLLNDLGLTDLGNNPPMRTWFVGILFLLGFFLYLYKGSTFWENVFLNAAGLSALGVALFPMTGACALNSSCPDYGKLHGGFALITFISIGTVALVFTKNTLDWLPPEDTAKTAAYRWWYRIIGWLFIALVGFALVTMPGDNWPQRIYYLELFGVILFAAYWWLKSNELSEKRDDSNQQFEKLAIKQNPEQEKDLQPEMIPGASTQGQAAAD
jgi:hypothetical protein